MSFVVEFLASGFTENKKDTVRCGTLIAEVPGHRLGQVTQCLIVSMLKTLLKHTQTLESQMRVPVL